MVRPRLFSQKKQAPVISHYNKVDEQRAMKLHETLRRHQLGRKAINWAQSFGAFAELRRVVSAHRIDKALEWYCGHVGQDYVPRILSAKWFRFRFVDIEHAMGRELMSLPVEELAKQYPIENVIARRAKALNDELTWPGSEGRSVALFLQVSYNNIKLFIQWLRGPKHTPRQQRFARLVADRLGNGLELLESRLMRLWEMANEWSKWQGKLMPFVVTVDDREFSKWGYALSNEYSGSPLLWDELIAGYKNGAMQDAD